jgi:HPt (histidine-containing phosphotransfer) domain-containing protein
MAHLGKQALGDPGLEEEILRLFDTMSRTYYERLETSTDVEQLLRHLHTLKGAAAGVGAWTIADLARTTEAELRSGAPVNPERIDDLGMAVHECSAFIGERLLAGAAA